jgi:hypothetical protein
MLNFAPTGSTITRPLLSAMAPSDMIACEASMSASVVKVALGSAASPRFGARARSCSANRSFSAWAEAFQSASI